MQNNSVNYVDIFGLKCEIVWEFGGVYYANHRIEAKAIGRFGAIATQLIYATKQAFLAMRPSIDLFPDWPKGHGIYKIIFKEFARTGKMIRYYEKCTDECTGEVTKEFLFETEGNLGSSPKSAVNSSPPDRCWSFSSSR